MTDRITISRECGRALLQMFKPIAEEDGRLIFDWNWVVTITELERALAAYEALANPVQDAELRWEGSVAREALTPAQGRTGGANPPTGASEAQEQGPNGLANLTAILGDQPYKNSPLSVVEIETILANFGGFMPDEAVVWFREWRAQRTRPRHPDDAWFDVKDEEAPEGDDCDERVQICVPWGDGWKWKTTRYRRRTSLENANVRKT